MICNSGLILGMVKIEGVDNTESKELSIGTGRGLVAACDARERIGLAFWFLGLLVTIADPSFFCSQSSHSFCVKVSASLLPPHI